MYENINDIKEQFKSVIAYSQDIDNPKVDYLFDRWAANKAEFIALFGGLIYEWPETIELTLDDRQKEERAMEFANTVNDTFDNIELATFIDRNIGTFFENRVAEDITINGITVPKNMKLLKAFKLFEKNKTALRTMQDLASNIIQENKIKGKLCFSVHPLDFLSSSENTYNWRSCHALDGEYRAGNLSYMVDNSTFMVYLKGEDDQYLRAFGDVMWNSKKWRALIHANDLIMFAGRQYPFSSKAGLDTALGIFNNLICKYKNGYCTKFSGWSDNYVDSYVPKFDDKAAEFPTDLRFLYLIYDRTLIPIDKAVKKAPNTLNYNDVLDSTCYKYPYYSIYNPFGFHAYDELINNPVEVGGEVPCLHCGRELIQNPETMRCDECELEFGTEVNDTYYNCDCCGARIYRDDGYFVDDEIVCDKCFDKHCFTCDWCGETFYDTEKVFREEDGEISWYCRHCANEM